MAGPKLAAAAAGDATAISAGEALVTSLYSVLLRALRRGKSADVARTGRVVVVD